MLADANTDPKCGWGGAGLPQGGICLDELPTSTPAIPATINTDAPSPPTLCRGYSKGGSLDYCVIAGVDLAVPNVRVTGSKPLVIIATGTLTVSGRINASSQTVTNPGAGVGSDPIGGCNYGTGPNDGANPETRGAAGGSFGSKGGRGALRNNQPFSDVSGVPGSAMPLTPPAILRGGCRGQDGYMTGAAVGGRGGGAIYLVAGAAIEVAAGGWINASGGAGNGGPILRGGAGGGSGGMIVLEAPLVDVRGPVFADGGGGGEGGGGQFSGAAGFEANGSTPAGGGSGAATSGGDGGDGSHGSMVAKDGGTFNNSDTGGGGGGGGGIIWIHDVQGGARTGVISPSPTPI